MIVGVGVGVIVGVGVGVGVIVGVGVGVMVGVGVGVGVGVIVGVGVGVMVGVGVGVGWHPITVKRGSGKSMTPDLQSGLCCAGSSKPNTAALIAWMSSHGWPGRVAV